MKKFKKKYNSKIRKRKQKKLINKVKKLSIAEQLIDKNVVSTHKEEKNNNNNENTLNEKTFENTRLNKIMIKINKLIISKDVFLQKVYRKIFIR